MANDEDKTPPTNPQPGPSRLTPAELQACLDAKMDLARQDALERLAEDEAIRTGKSQAEAMAVIRNTLLAAQTGSQSAVKEENVQRSLNPKEENYLEQTLENIASQVKTIRTKDEQTKLLQESIGQALEAIEAGTLNEESRQKVSNLISAAATIGDISIKAPDFVAQMRLPAMREHYDQRGVVSKLIQQIRKFKGDERDYKWPQFWARYSVAVQNTAYNRFELRAIFLSCIDGSAMEHYRAFLQDYSNMSYDQLVKAFKDCYDDTREISMATLMGKAQATN
jgi:hypothetical protein